MVDDSLSETPNLPALPDDPGQFILYQTEDGRTRVEVRFFGETVWLSLKQMADLFQRDKSVISRHIANVFEEGELDRGNCCRICNSSNGRGSPSRTAD